MRHMYLPMIDHGLIYDNSDGSGVLIAEQPLGDRFIVYDRTRWSQIEEATR